MILQYKHVLFSVLGNNRTCFLICSHCYQYLLKLVRARIATETTVEGRN